METATESRDLQRYLQWIINKTGLTRYTHLSRVLFDVPFRSCIRMDENRASDGLYMREEYIDRHPGSEYGVSCHLDGQCSVLEFLVSFSDRVEEATSYRHDRRYWVSYFLENMGLIGFDDRYFADNPDREPDVEGAIAERLSRTLDRRYSHDGSHGGLFVLRRPPCDLRNVEYWWQMQYYVLERYMPKD